MATSEEIHDLLDRHLHALTALGSPAAQHLGDPIPPETIQQQLEREGYSGRIDVVAFYSWRRYPPLGPAIDDLPRLFAGQPHPLPLDLAIELYRTDRDVIIDVVPEWQADQRSFPGPAYLLPIATSVDAVGWTAIDSRNDPDGGRVFQCDHSDDVRPIFASLADAIATATYCLEVGLWTVAPDGRIDKSTP